MNSSISILGALREKQSPNKLAFVGFVMGLFFLQKESRREHSSTLSRFIKINELEHSN